MIELLIATKNQGKRDEIHQLFLDQNLDINLYSLSDLGIDEDFPENGSSFIENATGKSLFYNSLTRQKGIEKKIGEPLVTIGDDSGLSVEALNGAPGILSSRYSGPGANDEKNIAKLLHELQGIENRQAKFVCTLCLSFNGNILATFTGEVQGIIIDEKRGHHGFGYDPIFFYPPLQKTFAEIPAQEKNRISHRASAFTQLKNFLTHCFQNSE